MKLALEGNQDLNKFKGRSGKDENYKNILKK